ncbi:hypothetical protein IPA_05565 [Ignicoccus pacificus DSM 13166]|uniref:Ribbon-helix-helix protein CopG domain-containing protein n=1 Tax=Ignicoccus pacificus DSM 13166 TaxID=940294 RepID=A0A977PK58_9CREN|nr:hypothetical protein IPA_05565 [Ignicoccus pacificus DSM 13166]
MTELVRFGISIPKDLLEELERGASALGVSRSKLIEIAIRSFIGYLSLIEGGSSKGLMVLVIVHSGSSLQQLIELVSSLTSSFCISKEGKSYIITAMLKGEIEKVKDVVEKVRKVKGTAIYPLLLGVSRD